MDFPIAELLDEEKCLTWLINYFHPQGLQCPQCGAGRQEARHFRRLKRSGLPVYRCKRCAETYTVYTGTVFAGKHLRPDQVILLLRGFSRGEPSARLAREIGVSRFTVATLRRAIQHQPEEGSSASPPSPLS